MTRARDLADSADKDIAGTLTLDDLTVDNNVGIGDADPLDKLEVKTTTLGGITISSPTHNYAALSFARNSTATARIFISEPAATHTSAIHLQTSDASGGPNLITAMTIDQNQNVGIGTSSPSDDLEINPSADEKGITLKTTNSIRPYFNFDANRSGASQQLGRIQGKWNGNIVTRIEMVSGSDTTNKDDGFITFQTASSSSDLNERMRISNSGATEFKFGSSATTMATFANSASVNGVAGSGFQLYTPLSLARDSGTSRSAWFAGNLKFDSGYGIDFSATGNSTGSVATEILSDYEQGTWSPTLSTTGTAPTYNTSGTAGMYGRYTRIGDQVTAYFDCYFNITNPGTGAPVLANFPFGSNAATGYGGYSAASLRNCTALNASIDVTAYYYGTSIIFEQYTGYNSTTGINWRTANNIRVTGYVTYYVI